MKYIIADAGGNTTAIVTSSVDRNCYASAAGKLISETNHAIEQVGYIERGTLPGSLGRLQMMGGEFCGNAARSFGAWQVLSRKPNIGGLEMVPVEISGCGKLLSCRVTVLSADSADAEILLPLPEKIITADIPGIGWASIVCFSGIIHVIFQGHAVDKAILLPVLDYLRTLGLSDSCVGLMFLSVDAAELIPYVYVRESNTAVMEGSCGSGSGAVACYLAQKNNASVSELKLKQPHGMLTVSARWDGRQITELRLSGTVTFSNL